jgi:ribokinase
MTLYFVGNCTVDVFFMLDHFPEPGETMIASERFVDLGGKGANQAFAAHRFGLPVHLVAPIGDDADGQWARERLVAEGIGGEDLIIVETPTDQSIINVVPGGENTIVSSAMAAESLTQHDVARALQALAPGDAVAVQGNLTLEATVAALTTGKAAGVMTMLNPAPVRWSADKLWPLSSIAVLNNVEARALLGTDVPETAVRLLADRGVSTAIVTLGADGAVALASGRLRRIPAIPAHAVDTAGAGDTFCGALIAALTLGFDLDASLAVAIAAAAITVTRPGTQSAFPTHAEALELIDHQKRGH